MLAPLLVGALVLLRPATPRAEPPSPPSSSAPGSPDQHRVDREARLASIERALAPALAAVLRPMPPLPSASMEDKLAFLAELGRRADLGGRHSGSTAWRAIMNWPDPSDGLSAAIASPAPDESLERYPIPAGRSDPALDFAASVALAALDSRRFSCDFPLRARYLADHGLAHSPLPIEQGRCRAFSRWADLERVEAIEVIYVTPSWSDPSASMGHVIFRVRHSGAERVTGQSFEPAFAYAAIDDPATPFYMLKGLTGHLTASMTFETMGEVHKRYGDREGRDLIRFELLLSERERRFFLAHVYVQRMRRMAVPYAFLTTNCATLAYDLVRAVMPELPRKSSFLMHPHEVISALLAANRARPVGILPSAITRARFAERKIEELEARQLAGALPPELAIELLEAKIDLETWAIDQRIGHHDPSATSARLDSLLDERADLPIRPEDDRFLPPPDQPIPVAGSRLRQVALGVDDRSRPRLMLGLAILDETIGAPRVAALRHGGRMKVLASETVFSRDGDEVRLEAQHFTVLSTMTLGDRPRSELGFFASRMGFTFHLETMTRPAEGLDFGAILRGGPALTLASSADFGDHLVVALTAELSNYTRDQAIDDDLLMLAGLELEAGLRLDRRNGHSLRLTARAATGWSFPRGFAWLVESSLAVDLVVSRRRGLILQPMMRWRHHGPLEDRLELSLGLLW